jgi:hypothetical protein
MSPEDLLHSGIRIDFSAMGASLDFHGGETG